MERMFEHCLSPHYRRTSTAIVDVQSLRNDTTNLLQEDAGDTALQNLVGNCEAIAERWAQDGKLRKKLDMLRGYLSGEERALVDVILNRGKPLVVQPGLSFLGPGERRRYEESDDETNDGSHADDERGRTAHALFAKLAGLEESQPEKGDDSAERNSLLINAQSIGFLAAPERNDSPCLRKSMRDSMTPTPRHIPIHASPVTPTAHMKGDIQASASSLPHVQNATPSTPTSARRDQLMSPPRSHAGPLKRILVGTTVIPSPSFHIPLTDVKNYAGGRSPSSFQIKRLDSSETTPTKNPSQRSESHDPIIMQSDTTPISKQKTPVRNFHQIRMAVDKLNGSPSRKRKHHSVMTHPEEGSRKLPRATNTSTTPISSMNVGASSVVESPTPEIRRERAERHARRLERLAVAERLARARPDLVAPSYTAKRAQMLKRNMRHVAREQYFAGMRMLRAKQQKGQRLVDVEHGIQDEGAGGSNLSAMSGVD